VRIMLLSVCQFCEKWYREGCTFLMGVSDVAVTHVPRNNMAFESNVLLFKHCVLRHLILDLQCSCNVYFQKSLNLAVAPSLFMKVNLGICSSGMLLGSVYW
jgi:hypothetical protein